jgi:hypothetical protein
MTYSLPKRVTMSPEVLFRELDGEAVLLDLNTERYYGLDDVGTRIWQLLAEHGDVDTAHNLLLSEYEVDGDTLWQDMADLLGRLAEAGLISLEE